MGAIAAVARPDCVGRLRLESRGSKAAADAWEGPIRRGPASIGVP